MASSATPRRLHSSLTSPLLHTKPSQPQPQSKSHSRLGLPLSIPHFSTRYLVLAITLMQAVGCLYLLQSRFGGDVGLGLQLSLGSKSLAACIEGGGIGRTAGAKDTLDMPLLATSRPAGLLRDNLRADVKYITAWPTNGWSNQVIQFMHLIYLARLTERVPILPRFRHENGGSSVDIDFGAVFDLERLRNQLRTPILEWKDVKDVDSDKLEELGCWDIHHKTWESDPGLLQAPTKLTTTSSDVSYTPVPEWVRSGMNMREDDLSLLMWPLASLVSFSERAIALRRLPEPIRSPTNDAALPPDDHLFCTNTLEFERGMEALQGRADMSPAWQSVGRHMRWTPAVDALAANATRATLGLAGDAPVPPYVVVHIRRGDFTGWCEADGVPLEECFAPLAAYERRVREVRAEILEDTGVFVERVLVTGDEANPGWWEAVSALGWLRPDHSATMAKYGAWYAMFVDAAIQGGAYGFVGTERSAASILARRRVAGRGGVAEMVKWGRPHADDH
ncbi:hypothetical protein MKEN_01321300 [Mycena kentingensis (nom. inval.)]|nr:hypothetical protein MKEN_01321300 [Mycena kentingensis (nom. inval.)]